MKPKLGLANLSTIPPLWRLKQDGGEFEVSLGYRERSLISGNEGRELVRIFSKQRKISPPHPVVPMLGVRVELTERLGDDIEDLSGCY